MKFLFFLGIVLLRILVTPMAAQTPWKLKKSSEGVEVYYRKTETSPINEIKIKTTLTGSMEALLEIMRNVRGYTQWVYKCIETDLLERPSPFEAVYYGVMDFPWPLNDRDFIAKSKMTVQSNGKIIIEVRGLSEYLKPRDSRVRIPTLDYRWELTPADNQKILLEYTLRSDPGGVLPAWVINLGIDQGPTQTVRNLRQILEKTSTKQVLTRH